MNPEVFQAVLMHSGIDLRTAFHLKECCKDARNLLTEDDMNTLVIPKTVDEDSPDVLWFARFARKATCVRTLCDLQKRLRKGDECLISDIANSDLFDEIFFDTHKQERFMRVCLNFETYENPERINTIASILYCVFPTRYAVWTSENVPIEKRVQAFVFFLNILVSTIQWAIHHWHTAKDMKNTLPFMFDSAFLYAIEIKTVEFARLDLFRELTNLPNDVQHMYIALHLAEKVIFNWRIDIDYTGLYGHVRKPMRAWQHMLTHVSDMKVGVKGGVYTVNEKGTKKYW